MPRQSKFDAASLLPLPTAAFHILIALADGDRHGYATMQDVAAGTGGRRQLNPDTLYTTIRPLRDQGLIIELDERPDPEEDDERRRYYRLTDIGREVATAEAARLQQALAFARQVGLVPKRT